MNETQKVLVKSKQILDAYKLNQKRKEGERLLELLPQGHGSGLNADLLDGHHATEIVEKAVRESARIPIRVPTSGGGLATHGNEFHTSSFYSSEPDIPVLTDAKYPNALLLDGSRAMTGNLTLPSKITFSDYTGCTFEAINNSRMRYSNALIEMLRIDVNYSALWDYPRFMTRQYNEESFLATSWKGDVNTDRFVFKSWPIGGGAYVDVARMYDGRFELAAGKLTGDLDVSANNIGPLLIDRTTATKYRLYVDGGVLGIEAV